MDTTFQQQPQPMPTQPQSPTPQPNPQAPKSGNSTILYLIIVILVIASIALAYMYENLQNRYNDVHSQMSYDTVQLLNQSNKLANLSHQLASVQLEYNSSLSTIYNLTHTNKTAPGFSYSINGTEYTSPVTSGAVKLPVNYDYYICVSALSSSTAIGVPSWLNDNWNGGGLFAGHTSNNICSESINSPSNMAIAGIAVNNRKPYSLFKVYNGGNYTVSTSGSSTIITSAGGIGSLGYNVGFPKLCKVIGGYWTTPVNNSTTPSGAVYVALCTNQKAGNYSVFSQVSSSATPITQAYVFPP